MIRRIHPRPTRRWAIAIDGGKRIRRMITGVPLHVSAHDLRFLLRSHGIAYGVQGDWTRHVLVPEERWTPAMRRSLAGNESPPIPWRSIAPDRPGVFLQVVMPIEVYAAACAAAEERAMSLNALILEALQDAQNLHKRIAAQTIRRSR